MDMTYDSNYTRLCGSIAGNPVYSHSSRSQQFYIFPLEIERLSGNRDIINIVVRREQLAELTVQSSGKLWVEGQLRTFNNRHGQGAKLVITVLARQLGFCDGEDENLVQLMGTLCKAPNLRTTPMGRDICDLMLAVNRHYGRSDYLPCICWGIKAREASQWTVGTQLRLQGRIQSRNYIKLTEEGPVEKTAFEVSVTEIEPVSQEESLIL
ncbi:MAG TPA: single-stranded DNA-binding protein [Candidatus Limivicinus faecipullorum]|nr:single-stranded DNA-binding protein [Candidatus Limivicinus faecipullorum]